MKRGWKNGSIGKVPTSKRESMMWDTQHQLKEGHSGTICSPDTWMGRKEAAAISGAPECLDSQCALGAVSKNKVKSDRRLMPTSGIHSYVHVHMYKYARAHMHKIFFISMAFMQTVLSHCFYSHLFLKIDFFKFYILVVKHWSPKMYPN